MKDILKQLEQLIKQHALEQIMPRFNQGVYRLKTDGSLVTEADVAMQQAMVKSLQTHWPDYAVLGEEMSVAQQQALLNNTGLNLDLSNTDLINNDSTNNDQMNKHQGLWIVDPLDGTSNFAGGIPIFSVSVALLINNEIVLGVIYDPNRDEMFSAIKGQGAWLNGQVLKAHSDRTLLSQCTAQIDFKRLTAEMRICLSKDHPYASQRNFGSGALDWCWLATGRSQVYIHGGQKLWDYVAGLLILAEAGGQATTFTGQAIFSASLQPRSIMAAVNPLLFSQLEKTLSAMDCQKK